jgi:hypothetical protein
MNDMNNFQNEVIEERDDLSVKLGNLCSFLENSEIFDELDDDEKERLTAQREIMSEYLDILEERISYLS